MQLPAGLITPLRAEARPLSRHTLPARQTSFVGRALELAELAELLAVPDCRLLTIIGPGGIGKARLTLEPATSVQSAFADGVAFASLQAVTDAEALAPALAAAVGCAGPFGLDVAAIDAMLLNGVRKSFLPDERRDALTAAFAAELAALKVEHLLA